MGGGGGGGGGVGKDRFYLNRRTKGQFPVSRYSSVSVTRPSIA